LLSGADISIEISGGKSTFAFFRSKRFHLLATILWACLLPPTLLWWRESVFWVAIMSWYANVVGHWSAYQSARSEESGNDACV